MTFSHVSIAFQAVVPLLPAKQRCNQPADWMEIAWETIDSKD
jgi:hypothetical protein